MEPTAVFKTAALDRSAISPRCFGKSHNMDTISGFSRQRRKIRLLTTSCRRMGRPEAFLYPSRFAFRIGFPVLECCCEVGLVGECGSQVQKHRADCTLGLDLGEDEVGAWSWDRNPPEGGEPGE